MTDTGSNIRRALPGDIERVGEIALATGLFDAETVVAIREMMSAHFAGELGEEHHWLVVTDARDAVVGGAYYAPENFAGEGVWNLYMIAVAPDQHSQGIGRSIMRYVENQLRDTNGRLLLVETSSADSFQRTRRFYTQCGYTEEARIRDYYGPGEAKVIFWKAL